jgi:1-acyl-sn-glycerol-3-phosphate acyltransferase
MANISKSEQQFNFFSKFLSRSKLWRIFATGFSFVAFGIGGAIIALTWFVLLHFVVRDKLKRQRYSRRTIANVFYRYVKMMHFLGLLTYKFDGLEKLKSGQLVISNHPSLLDVVFLVSVVKECTCVVKPGLKKNIFTYGPITGSNYITSDDENILDSCVESLKEGYSLVIFPEGTRTVPGESVKFKRGATNIALAAQANILPIKIKCTPPTLLKGQKWYQVPNEPPHFSFSVLDEIDISPYVESDAPRSIKNRRLTNHLYRLLIEDDETIGSSSSVNQPALS